MQIPFKIRCINQSKSRQTIMAYQQDMWLGLFNYYIGAWAVFSLEPGAQQDIEIPQQFEIFAETKHGIFSTSQSANIGERWVVEPRGEEHLHLFSLPKPTQGPFTSIHNRSATHPVNITLRKAGRPILACTVGPGQTRNLAPQNTLFLTLSKDYEQAELYEALTISESHHIDLKTSNLTIASITDGPHGARLSHH